MKNAVLLLFGLIIPMPFCGTIGHKLPTQQLLTGMVQAAPKMTIPAIKKGSNHHIKQVIETEGGYQNHPYDFANKGVGTKYGITPLTYKKYTGKAATEIAMKSLTTNQAASIYLQIWQEVNMDLVPDEVAGEVFDFYINTPKTCLQVMERITGTTGSAKNWAISPQMADAIKRTKNFKAKLYEARRQYFLYRAAKYNPTDWHAFYRKIGKKGSSQNAQFLEGWLNRIANFCQAPQTL